MELPGHRAEVVDRLSSNPNLAVLHVVLTAEGMIEVAGVDHIPSVVVAHPGLKGRTLDNRVVNQTSLAVDFFNLDALRRAVKLWIREEARRSGIVDDVEGELVSVGEEAGSATNHLLKERH